MTSRRLGRVMFVAAPLLACGAGNGGSGTVDNGVGDPVLPVFDSPPVDLLMDSVCTFVARCGLVSRKLTCVQGLVGSAGRMLADTASAITAGTILYHQDLAGQCASLAMNAACTIENQRLVFSTCESAFEGKTAAGGACHTSYECVGGGTCENACAAWETISCCDGTCGPPETTTPGIPAATAPDGQPCSSAGPGCEMVTSYCEPASSTCQPRLPVGAKCSRDADCIGYATCWNGACRKQPDIGEICQDSSGAVLQCQAGGCDSSTNRCATTTAVVRCF